MAFELRYCARKCVTYTFSSSSSASPSLVIARPRGIWPARKTVFTTASVTVSITETEFDAEFAT